MNHPIHVDPWRSESDTQVAGTVHDIVALGQFAALDEWRGYDRISGLRSSVD
jgi:hypothetical protein